MILIYTLVNFESTEAAQCYETTFPRVLGSNRDNKNVQFNAMDIDTKDNIAIGGQITDDKLAASGSTSPFLLYIMDGNYYLWAYTVSALNKQYKNVRDVRFTNSGGSLIAAILDTNGYNNPWIVAILTS